MTTKPNDRFAKLEDKAKAEVTPEQIRERTLARAKADAAVRAQQRAKVSAERKERHEAEHGKALADQKVRGESAETDHKKRLEADRAERDHAVQKILADEAVAVKQRDAAREKLLAPHVASASTTATTVEAPASAADKASKRQNNKA